MRMYTFLLCVCCSTFASSYPKGPMTHYSLSAFVKISSPRPSDFLPSTKTFLETFLSGRCPPLGVSSGAYKRVNNAFYKQRRVQIKCQLSKNDRFFQRYYQQVKRQPSLQSKQSTLLCVTHDEVNQFALRAKICLKSLLLNLMLASILFCPATPPANADSEQSSLDVNPPSYVGKCSGSAMACQDPFTSKNGVFFFPVQIQELSPLVKHTLSKILIAVDCACRFCQSQK